MIYFHSSNVPSVTPAKVSEANVTPVQGVFDADSGVHLGLQMDTAVYLTHLAVYGALGGVYGASLVKPLRATLRTGMTERGRGYMSKFYVSLFVLLFSFGVTASAQTTSVHRFALVAGSNDGGLSRVKLRYATTDAESVANVLQEIGGVSKEDLLSLSNPDTASMKDAFGSMKAMVIAAKKKNVRTEFFLYYSGHSDEEGLLLNGVLFKYSELRALINEVNADVRVAIVDSCASGALTLQKGGTKKAPFLRDDSTAVKGRAYLTSSSADEVAQESERIGASFFTYYLVTGLRGAADSTKDGKITLHEAYQYAFAETLARTENTKYGPQHPAYEIQLTGTGDLVMTDIRETTASIAFDSSLVGQLYIRDSKGRLISELRKEKGSASSLALAPGTYKINIEREQKLYQASITLESGKKQSLTAASFTEANKEVTVARGDEVETSAMPLDTGEHIANATPQEEAGEALDPTAPAPIPTDKPKRLALNLSLTPNMSLGRVFGDRTISAFSLGFFDGNQSLHGASIGILASYVSEDLKGVQITPGIAIAKKDIYGGQIGAMGTFAGQNLTGFQIGTAGVVERDVLGMQATATLNMVGGDFTGLQASAMFNSVAKDFVGLQAAASNAVGGNFSGLQASGGLNLVGKEMRGLQAGVINFVREDAYGLQASVANVVAGNAYGLQASVINISRDVMGAQIGVVNIAKNVKGTQIGVVNISNQIDGVPIGVISVVKKGMYRLDAWSSDVAAANLGLRIGSKRAYSLFTCGIIGSLATDIACGMGLGVRKPGEKLSFNLDATTISTIVSKDGSEDMLNSVRLFAELKPIKSWPLSVFAGPTVNAIVTFGPEVPEVREVLPGQLYRGDNASVLLAPGVILGISL